MPRLAVQLIPSPIGISSMLFHGKTQSDAGTPVVQSQQTSSEESAFSIANGTALGQWLLVQGIAKGSHSEVYRASPLDRGTHSTADYAVKVVRQDRDPQLGKQLLQRQVIASNMISAPEVIPVLAADLDSERPHIVMPFIPGADLNSWLTHNSTQPLPVLLWIVRQIAQGLKEMHQHRWLHGDVQPANIIISDSGHLFLADLAFSQSLDNLEADFGTGNRLYAAPERWTATPELSPASEVYSLGIIFYELLAGQLPVECGTEQQYSPAALQESASILRRKRPSAPVSIERVLARLMARQPSRRPTLSEVVPVLMALEIETFGQHINPSSKSSKAA